MAKRLARLFRRVAEWLDPHYNPALLSRARELTKLAEETHVGSGFGEARRHQVYARLIKEFPSWSRRAISLVIEAALD